MEGEGNTRFFHTSEIIKQKKKGNHHDKGCSRELDSGYRFSQGMVRNYFVQLYSSKPHD